MLNTCITHYVVLYQEMQHDTKDTRKYKNDNMQGSKITSIKLIWSNHNNKRRSFLKIYQNKSSCPKGYWNTVTNSEPNFGRVLYLKSSCTPFYVKYVLGKHLIFQSTSKPHQFSGWKWVNMPFLHKLVFSPFRATPVNLLSFFTVVKSSFFQYKVGGIESPLTVRLCLKQSKHERASCFER